MQTKQLLAIDQTRLSPRDTIEVSQKKKAKESHRINIITVWWNLIYFYRHRVMLININIHESTRRISIRVGQQGKKSIVSFLFFSYVAWKERKMCSNINCIGRLRKELSGALDLCYFWPGTKLIVSVKAQAKFYLWNASIHPIQDPTISKVHQSCPNFLSTNVEKWEIPAVFILWTPGVHHCTVRLLRAKGKNSFHFMNTLLYSYGGEIFCVCIVNSWGVGLNYKFASSAR